MPPDPVEPHFAVTFFPDRYAPTKEELSSTLTELANIIQNQPPGVDKASLPWLKLATFGHQLSDGNSLRHNANVVSISGLEGDYDGGKITFDEAVALVRAAGVAALLYTTPSNTDAAPHWRVLCPLSASLEPARRTELMDGLNGIIGGGLARESWTLSQAYYFGNIAGCPPVRVEIIEGDCIDQRDDIEPIAKPGGKANIAGGPWSQDGNTWKRGDTSFTIVDGRVAVTTPDKNWSYYADTPSKIDEARWYMDGQKEKGQAIDNCYAHAGMLRDFGLSPDRSVALLVEYGNDEDHALTRVESLWRYAQNPPGEKMLMCRLGGHEASPAEVAKTNEPGPRANRFMSRAQAKHMPPAEYLVEGLLPQYGDAQLVAPSGYLKSFMAVDIACSVATGRDALSQFKVNKPGPVLYFAAEGAQSLQKKRITAWEIENAHEPYSIKDVFVTDVVPLIGNKAFVDELIADAKELLNGRKPALFINDTLNRALDGENENDSAIASRYFAMIHYIRQQLGGGLYLTIHHTGWTATDRGRGSSAFFAGWDASLIIEEHVKDRTTGQHDIMFRLDKLKDDDDERQYRMRSKLIVLPDGGKSLALVPLDGPLHAPREKDELRGEVVHFVLAQQSAYGEDVVFEDVLAEHLAGARPGEYVSVDEHTTWNTRHERMKQALRDARRKNRKWAQGLFGERCRDGGSKLLPCWSLPEKARPASNEGQMW